MESKPSMPLLIVLGILSAIAIGLAIFGWWHILPGSDAIYVGLKAIHADESYNEVAQTYDGNVFLQLGRFVGYLIEPLGLFILFLALFRQSLIRLAAFARGRHVVVVGQSAFADKLSESQTLPVVHLRGISDGVHEKGGLIRLPFSGFNVHSLNDAGAKKAISIVIAPESDAQAIDLAVSAQKLFPDIQVHVRLNDYWLARTLHDVRGAQQLRAFSEPNLAASYVVRRYPPYLMAQDNGQARIHALLIGDHDWLEAVMLEIIVNAGTLTYGRPAFSVICTEPDVFKAQLMRRYPEIALEADLVFHRAQHLSERETFAADLMAIDSLAPVTCVYSMFSNGADGLSNALAFVQQARGDAGFNAPVFVLSSSRGMDKPAPGSRLEPLEIVSFGSLEDMAEASGLMTRDADLAERHFHSAYLAVAGQAGSEAAKPWNALKEEYRISNRLLVAHICAKLFDAGFDLRPWMARDRLWRELPILATGEKLFRTPDERERLAELEHQRWIADRRMGGWRYGAERDDKRKLHPDIVPFAQLPEKTKDYDRNFIDTLDGILRRRHDGIRRNR